MSVESAISYWRVPLVNGKSREVEGVESGCM